MENAMTLDKRIVLAAGFASFALLFAGSGQAQSECRTAPLPDGTPAMFCKDRNGNWKQQAGKVVVQQPSATSAVPVYADATYRGTAVWQIPVQQRQRRTRSITDLIINSAQPTTRPFEIFVSTTMRIEGSVVTGTITGGSWRNNVPINGSRKGNVCNITGTNAGSTIVYIGTCDETGFRGTMTEYKTRGEPGKGSFQLDATSFTDTSARDTRRVELKMKCDGGSMEACVELERLK